MGLTTMGRDPRSGGVPVVGGLSDPKEGKRKMNDLVDAQKRAKRRQRQRVFSYRWSIFSPPNNVDGFCACSIQRTWFQHCVLEHLVRNLQGLFQGARCVENRLYLSVSLSSFGAELVREGRVTSQDCCEAFGHCCLCQFGVFPSPAFKQPVWWILKGVVQKLLECRQMCLARGRSVQPLVQFLDRHGGQLLIAREPAGHFPGGARAALPQSGLSAAGAAQSVCDGRVKSIVSSAAQQDGGGVV